MSVHQDQWKSPSVGHIPDHDDSYGGRPIVDIPKMDIISIPISYQWLLYMIISWKSYDDHSWLVWLIVTIHNFWSYHPLVESHPIRCGFYEPMWGTNMQLHHWCITSSATTSTTSGALDRHSKASTCEARGRRLVAVEGLRLPWRAHQATQQWQLELTDWKTRGVHDLYGLVFETRIYVCWWMFVDKSSHWHALAVLHHALGAFSGCVRNSNIKKTVNAGFVLSCNNDSTNKKANINHNNNQPWSEFSVNSTAQLLQQYILGRWSLPFVLVCSLNWCSKLWRNHFCSTTCLDKPISLVHYWSTSIWL